jgi:pimeloyl-ACP methyl ester carboxylesterase/DNA-binding CsgD family transcriptional regulator
MKQRNDLIAKAYDAAISPDEYDNLVTKWSEYLAAFDQDFPSEISKEPSLSDFVTDEEIFDHFARAAIIFQKFSNESSSQVPQDFIKGDDRAALVINADGNIEATNSKPGEIFHDLKHIRDLEPKLRAGDYARLQETISQQNHSINAHSPTVILCEDNHGVLSHFVVVPANTAKHQASYFILRSLQPRWSKELQSVLMNVFELTNRECEIVEGWCNSLSISDLAKQHNRSVETLRTQVKTILSKTGTGSQAALMRLISGLSSLFIANSVSEHDSIAQGQTRIFKLQDGREIETNIYGPDHGEPVVFIHGMLGGMVIWKELGKILFEHNIKLIVPNRPSFGNSTPYSDRDTAPQKFAEDLFFILDTLKIKSVTLMAYGAGSVYAFAANTLHPQRVKRIVNFAGGVPITSRREFLKMKPRQSVMAFTARYAPSLLPVLVDGGISQIRSGLINKFIDALYNETPEDMQVAMRDDVYPIIQKNLKLSVEQGSTAFVTDAAHVTRDWSDLVKNAQTPVMLYHGVHDPVVPIDSVRAFADRWDHIELEEFDDVGQLIMNKHPHLIFKAISNLLK